MARVRLTQGHVAIVDAADVDMIRRHRWKVLKANGKLYACRTVMLSGRTETGRRRSMTLLMHRAIVKAGRGTQVDHRNNNGLDNRRENLRVCNQTQNLANMRKTRGVSRFKGVYWNKDKAKWQAQIGAGRYRNGKQRTLYLGRFTDETEAARAYDRKARELHGDFARTNFKGNGS